MLWGWIESRPREELLKPRVPWRLFRLSPHRVLEHARQDTHLTELTQLHVILQAALLNSFPTIFDELLQMFTVQEVAEFVRGTLGSMPSTVHIGQSMDVVKLQSIARTVDSRLFSFSGKSVLLTLMQENSNLVCRVFGKHKLWKVLPRLRPTTSFTIYSNGCTAFFISIAWCFNLFKYL